MNKESLPSIRRYKTRKKEQKRILLFASKHFFKSIINETTKASVKWATKNVQLVLQHCCKMSGKAMLRVLSLTLKTVSNLILIQDRFDVGGNTRKIAIQLACEQQTHFSGLRFTSFRKIASYFLEGEKRRPEMRLLFAGYYSTRFAAMLKDKLHDFCCPFFRT